LPREKVGIPEIVGVEQREIAAARGADAGVAGGAGPAIGCSEMSAPGLTSGSSTAESQFCIFWGRILLISLARLVTIGATPQTNSKENCRALAHAGETPVKSSELLRSHPSLLKRLGRMTAAALLAVGMGGMPRTRDVLLDDSHPSTRRL
jgi:hypothetical protein